MHLRLESKSKKKGFLKICELFFSMVNECKGKAKKGGNFSKFLMTEAKIRIRKKGTRDFLKRIFFFFIQKRGIRENNLNETKIKIAYQIGEDVQKADPTQEVLFCL